MKNLIITILFMSIICACTTSKILNLDTGQKKSSEYLFKNSCWGVANLEKLYLKWNWVKLEKKNRMLHGPFSLEFRMIRYNQFKDVVYNELIYKTRKTKIPINKKFKLYSPFYTAEFFVKDIKRMLMKDLPYFRNEHLNNYTVKQWEEKEELGRLYETNGNDGWRESSVMNNQKNASCDSSFMKKTPHVVRIILFDGKKREIIASEIPLGKIERSPPYFNKYELSKLGMVFKGELFPISVGVSIILEDFSQ